MGSAPCLVCQGRADYAPTAGESKRVTCHRCGTFLMTGTLDAMLRKAGGVHPLASYAIRRMARDGHEVPHLDTDLWERILATTVQPTPMEQAENAILYVGARTTPGGTIPLTPGAERSVLGSQDDQAFSFVVRHLIQDGCLIPDYGPNYQPSLTFRGWQRYEELRVQHGPQRRRGFMAMKFGNPLTEQLYREHFKPAARRAGYQLMRLDETPAAGVIDDLLRLELRRSRFVVADLTDGNRGAYWEGGFAEGLGRPVIYTCEAEVFRTERTHFDTNHLQTVVWERGNLSAAADRLTLAIRSTLPAEADLEDPADPP